MPIAHLTLGKGLMPKEKSTFIFAALSFDFSLISLQEGIKGNITESTLLTP